MDDRPRYMISVAAELVGMHPQTLRIYEQKGLVRPQRTPGNTRLYSERDLERLRAIQRLTSDLGLNLAGVERVLRLEDELNRMRAHLDRMERTAARIGLLLPPRARIESELFRTLDAAGNAESYARIIVTRGEGRFGLDVATTKTQVGQLTQ